MQILDFFIIKLIEYLQSTHFLLQYHDSFIVRMCKKIDIIYIFTLAEQTDNIVAAVCKIIVSKFCVSI